MPSIPGAGNQKNSCSKEQLALPNLKGSGFVFHICKIHSPASNKQNKVPLFF
jgi:hypothetical protein